MPLPPLGDGGEGAYHRYYTIQIQPAVFVETRPGRGGGDEVPRGTGLLGFPLSSGSCRDMFGVEWGGELGASWHWSLGVFPLFAYLTTILTQKTNRLLSYHILSHQILAHQPTSTIIPSTIKTIIPNTITQILPTSYRNVCCHS